MQDLEKRTRTFCIELYPDNTEHCKAIEILLNNECYYGDRHCAIIHNKDIYTDTTENHKEGDFKKAHWHFVLICLNCHTREQIAKKLNIEIRFIEPCEKYKAALCYLVHLNTEKYQYDTDKLVGDIEFISYIRTQVNNSSVNRYLAFKLMNDYITNYNGYLKLSDFNRFCFENGCLQIFKSFQLQIIKTIEEHNHFYKTKQL